MKNDLVSAIMVTKNNLDIVKKCINCFLEQTYCNKELIIVTEKTNKNLNYFKTLISEKIKLIVVEKENTTLGDLRNYGINSISDDFFIQWDDDDLYSKNRIKHQYEDAIKKNKNGNILVGVKIIKNNVEYHTLTKPFEGSLLYKKSKIFKKYPSLKSGEDTWFIENNNVLNNVSFLIGYEYYTYIVHKNSTYGNTYFKNNKINLIKTDK